MSLRTETTAPNTAVPAPTVSYGHATAFACQIGYDLASLNGNLALSLKDVTGTHADECRRELAKIHAALAGIEQHVAALPSLAGGRA